MIVTHEYEPGEIHENGEQEYSYNYLRYRFSAADASVGPWAAEAWAYLDEAHEVGIREVDPEGALPVDMIRYLNDRFAVIEVFKDGRPVRLDPAAIQEIIQ